MRVLLNKILTSICGKKNCFKLMENQVFPYWMHCNSHTNYVELAQTSPHFRHQPLPLGPPGYLCFLPTGNRFLLPLRFSSSLEWLTELRKVLYLWLHFCYKGYRSWATQWRDASGDVWEDLNYEASVFSRPLTLPINLCVSLARMLIWALVCRVGFFFKDFVYFL